MKKNRAFTVIELIVIVGIIALLSALAIPGYVQARHYAQRSAFAVEMRTTSEAFQMYSADNSRLPEAVETVQIVPGGMDAYMPKNSTWTDSPSIGGYWGWLNEDGPLRGYDGAIIFTGIQATMNQIAELDRLLDDGMLDGGRFQFDSGDNFIFYGIN